MSIVRLQTAALVGLAMIVSSCAPEAQEQRDAGGRDAIRSRLEALADAHYGERPHATWAADSTASAVVPGLKYHWIFVWGDGFHDQRYFTVASTGGRHFDAEELAGWAPIFGAWQPRDGSEALSFCAEAALVSVIGMLQHLGDSTSLTLDAELPTADESTRQFVTRAIDRTEIVPPSADRQTWDVRYWYLDGFPNRRRRVATRYRCQIPTDVRPLRIEAVDSIES
jgi:hypothetical protein